MWTHEPTDVDFQVLMVTASGLIVRFLKVLENYQNVKWMRYPTKAEGTYKVWVSVLLYLLCECSQVQF